VGRKRFITSDISTDEKLANVADKSEKAALMWPWFVTAFDDWGRMDVSSLRSLRLEIFPAFIKIKIPNIEEALNLYIEQDLIHGYEADGKKYIAVHPRRWLRWQSYLKGTKSKNADSTFPMSSNAPWPMEDEIWLRNEMAKKYKNDASIDNNCDINDISADVSRSQQISPMSVPSPSPSPSPTTNNLLNKYINDDAFYDGEKKANYPSEVEYARQQFLTAYENYFSAYPPADETDKHMTIIVLHEFITTYGLDQFNKALEQSKEVNPLEPLDWIESKLAEDTG
jgi:hypothetical protein